MADMATARRYCRILEDEPEDPVFEVCYDAAIQYMTGAGVPPMADNALYDLGVYMLTETWYDARGTMAIGQVPAPLHRSLQSIILQLRYDEGVGA